MRDHMSEQPSGRASTCFFIKSSDIKQTFYCFRK